MRKPCDQILCDPVREILLFGITREVVKGKDRDGRAALKAGDGEGIEIGRR